MRYAKRAESRDGHTITAHEAVLNPLQKRVQCERRLRSRQLRVRCNFAYQVFFIHEALFMHATNIKPDAPCQPVV